ncbi:MAG TPA: hypothetical protein PK992_20395 [Planctomycetaceae bacterium]|nr:hypothetical protein [Planctomycetaceae bacterium]
MTFFRSSRGLLVGASSLDVCNGHSDERRGYHYHVTPGKFPYVIGGYAGVPERTNIRGPRFNQVGAIEDNASGKSGQGKEIGTVLPGNAARGGKRSVRITLIPENARHPVVCMKNDVFRVVAAMDE